MKPFSCSALMMRATRVQTGTFAAKIAVITSTFFKSRHAVFCLDFRRIEKLRMPPDAMEQIIERFNQMQFAKSQ